MKSVFDDELQHHGVLGQKWGIRRYQNEDGTLTIEGKKRYGVGYGPKRKYARRYTKDLNRLNEEVSYRRGDKMSAEKKLERAKRSGNKEKIKKAKAFDAEMEKRLSESLSAEKRLVDSIVKTKNYTINSKEVSRFASEGTVSAVSMGAVFGGLVGAVASYAGAATVNAINGHPNSVMGTQYKVKPKK